MGVGHWLERAMDVRKAEVGSQRTPATTTRRGYGAEGQVVAAPP